MSSKVKGKNWRFKLRDEEYSNQSDMWEERQSAVREIVIDEAQVVYFYPKEDYVDCTVYGCSLKEAKKLWNLLESKGFRVSPMGEDSKTSLIH